MAETPVLRSEQKEYRVSAGSNGEYYRFTGKRKVSSEWLVTVEFVDKVRPAPHDSLVEKSTQIVQFVTEEENFIYLAEAAMRAYKAGIVDGVKRAAR